MDKHSSSCWIFVSDSLEDPTWSLLLSEHLASELGNEGLLKVTGGPGCAVLVLDTNPFTSLLCRDGLPRNVRDDPRRQLFRSTRR